MVGRRWTGGGYWVGDGKRVGHGLGRGWVEGG